MANPFSLTGVCVGFTEAKVFGRPKVGSTAISLRCEDADDHQVDVELSDPAVEQRVKRGQTVTVSGEMSLEWSDKSQRVFVGLGVASSVVVVPDPVKSVK